MKIKIPNGQQLKKTNHFVNVWLLLLLDIKWHGNIRMVELYYVTNTHTYIYIYIYIYTL